MFNIVIQSFPCFAFFHRRVLRSTASANNITLHLIDDTNRCSPRSLPQYLRIHATQLSEIPCLPLQKGTGSYQSYGHIGRQHHQLWWSWF
jgi:hypothetical protein